MLISLVLLFVLTCFPAPQSFQKQGTNKLFRQKGRYLLLPVEWEYACAGRRGIPPGQGGGEEAGERSPHLAKVDGDGGEWRKILGTHSELHMCWMPRTTHDSSRDRKGCGGPVTGLCLLSSGSYLYWVTAGLAFAEQWNVTTLSSSTGCGSTDRLTSGGSAERRESLADWGAVFMVLGKNEVGRPRKTP